MACYIISYDLRGDGRDYAPLYEAIHAYGTWAHINESVWAVVTARTAQQIRDDLLKYMSATDSLFVVKSGVEAAWRGVLCRSKWLKEYL